MHTQAVFTIALAAITFYVALHHLLYYVRLRHRKEFLSFALTCLAITYYDVASVGVYLSHQHAEGGLWQTQQVAALAGASIFMVMFISHLIHRKDRRLDYVLTAYWALQLVLLWVMRPEYIWPEVPFVKHVSVWGFQMVYFEMQPGLLVNIQTVVGLFSLLYMLASLVLYCRAGHRSDGLPVLIGMIGVAVGVANDSAVSSGVYSFFYCIEFSYLFLVLCMAYSLANLHLDAVRALRESEAKYSTLMETANDAVFVADAETGILVDMNHRAEELIGRPRAEVLNKPNLSLHPPEEADRYRKLFFEHAVRGGLITGDLCVLNREGRRIPVEISCSRAQIAGRKVIQGLFRDISERIRTETEMQRLAAAINAAAESIVITDHAGVILYVNPCFERMTGYTRDEAIGRKPSIVGSGKHDKAFYHNLWTTISSGQVWQGRFTNRRKDGSLFEEEAVISPIRDSKGAIVNYVAVKRDVTQELALENQLRHSQKMEAIGRLAGGIAHDFTNMLVIILNNAQFACKKLPADCEAIHNLKRIIEAAERSGALTGELMAFAHQRPLSLHVVDLGKTLRSAEDLLRRTIDPKVSLHLQLAKEAQIVEIDPTQLEQALVHLAINACEAMPQGGHLTITSETVSMVRGDFVQLPGGASKENRETVDYAVLSITDNGTGMSEDVQAHLFEPFFTTKGKGRSSGLGLSTTYGIVKKLHGHVTCYSVPGKGSSFRLFLPLLEPPPHYASGVPAGKETLLVVENNTLYRTYLVKVLQDLGYAVFEAEDEIQARDLLQRTDLQIDLAIVNMVLPRLEGRQLVVELAHRRPGLRILLTSGFPRLHLTACGELQNTDHFVSLPFARGELARAIRSALT